MPILMEQTNLFLAFQIYCLKQTFLKLWRKKKKKTGLKTDYKHNFSVGSITAPKQNITFTEVKGIIIFTGLFPILIATMIQTLNNL